MAHRGRAAGRQLRRAPEARHVYSDRGQVLRSQLVEGRHGGRGIVTLRVDDLLLEPLLCMTGLGARLRQVRAGAAALARDGMAATTPIRLVDLLARGDELRDGDPCRSGGLRRRTPGRLLLVLRQRPRTD